MGDYVTIIRYLYVIEAHGTVTNQAQEHSPITVLNLPTSANGIRESPYNPCSYSGNRRITESSKHGVTRRVNCPELALP